MIFRDAKLRHVSRLPRSLSPIEFPSPQLSPKPSPLPSSLILLPQGEEGRGGPFSLGENFPRASESLFLLSENSPRTSNSPFSLREKVRMRASGLFLLLNIVFGFGIISSVKGADVKQSRQEDGQFVGAIGCRSSSCHGGAGEKRSQYITWSRQDFHSRAFSILINARSARIAESVGLSEAQSSARCTVCHSPFQSLAPTSLASTARPDEGVSCENCHGAAGSWLRGHTRPDWTYAMRLSAGMHDLKNLYVRANSCVACHQNIDIDLIQAGHPTLAFELDSQSINEPKHWKDPDSWSGARAWLIGQAVALREAAWRSRADSEPARDMQETSLALAWLLARATLAAPGLPKVVEPTSSDLEPVQQQADNLARYVWTPTTDSMMSILRVLAETDPEFADRKVATQSFYRAKRVTLALHSLTRAVSANSGAPLKIDNELNALHEDVRSADRFDAARFAEHLRAFRSKL
jgi:Cytochrome c554 and c-prime